MILNIFQEVNQEIEFTVIVHFKFYYQKKLKNTSKQLLNLEIGKMKIRMVTYGRMYLKKKIINYIQNY